MDYDRFLPNTALNGKSRSTLWAAFQAAEKEAKQFNPTQWYEITDVRGSQHSRLWHPDDGRKTAWIEIIVPDKSDIHWGEAGGMFHETFHSSWHQCTLRPVEDDWGEGFCDAFRYFMEQRFCLEPSTHWRLNIERLSALTPDEALGELARANREDIGYNRDYGYPVGRIITKTRRDYGQFKALWFDAVARHSKSTKSVLNEMLGFSPRA
jgi:hypothetical protein